MIVRRGNNPAYYTLLAQSGSQNQTPFLEKSIIFGERYSTLLYFFTFLGFWMDVLYITFEAQK